MNTKYTAICVAFLFAAPSVGQDDAPPHKIDNNEARTLLASFKKQMRKHERDLRGRLQAVQTLGRNHNALLVTPLANVAKSDKSQTVRQAAVHALGRQPAKRARPILVNFLARSDSRREAGFAAALVRAISANCYTSRDWPTFKKIFEDCIDSKTSADLQRAILEAAGKNKEIKSVDFLAQHIDAPAPKWVDDPANPPAAYWEARFKNWQKWHTQVTDSLYEITGQRFGTGKAARAWLKKNAKTLRRSKSKKAR